MQWEIIKLRKEKKLKQSEMAKILAIHIYTYGKKERGDVAFSVDELFKMAQHFGLTLDEVYAKIEPIKSAMKGEK